jgi:hypothetical protein
MEEMGFDLLRILGCYFLFNEGESSWRGVGVIGKRLLLFCKFPDSVYLDGGFLCSQRSACAPLFVHSLCILSLMEY